MLLAAQESQQIKNSGKYNKNNECLWFLYVLTSYKSDLKWKIFLISISEDLFLRTVHFKNEHCWLFRGIKALIQV